MNKARLTSTATNVAPTVDCMTTVAIVEDNSSVRMSLRAILEEAAGVQCVGAYATAEEALRELPPLAPQVVLMDINLPGMDGVECVRRLAPLVPRTQFIMLTVHDDTEAIFESLAAGASGYLLKPVRSAALIAAVRDVYSGGSPMTSYIARKVVQSFKRPIPPAAQTESLSARELEILNLLTKGRAYKEIASDLGVTYRTVNTHIEHIYQKLHVRSRAEAVAKFHRL
jgi:DNA-binding NarL/FixJ family response regulator